jgi:hypothetical protein
VTGDTLGIPRLPGPGQESQKGWLALLGGGEFSFGETEDADQAWVERTPEGPVGFVPAASGSEDYAFHLSDYLDEVFEREMVTLPVYRARDSRRGKNAERVGEVSAVYLGGGVTDHLLEALEPGSPVVEALVAAWQGGRTVVAIAAAAQAVGQLAWSLLDRRPIPGLGWLPGTVVEPNFDPDHDHRLRRLLSGPGIERGIGIPAGSALLLGPDGEELVVGEVWWLEGAEGELVRVEEEG